MAIAKFQASAPAQGGDSGSSGNSKTLGIVVGVLLTAGLIYLGYKYVYLPAQAKKRQDEEES